MKLRPILIACALALIAAPAMAQTYPTKPVHLIVTFAPGGANDVQARLIADPLGQALGQPVVVENRVGGASNIGTEYVARAPADGYTLLFAVNLPFTTVGALYAKPPYDPIKDFAPVSLITAQEMLLMVHPSVPVSTVPEFVAYAKANPGKLDYGTPGNGTPMHLAMEMFKRQAGIDLVHVPYRGVVPALTDLVSGQIKVMFLGYGTPRAQIEAGTVKPIATTGNKRNPRLPALPTFAEIGFPKLEVTSWFSIVAPAGTPEPVVRRLNAEIVKIVNQPEMNARLRNTLDLEPIAGPPENLARAIASEVVKWGEVIRAANIKAD
jgi:tripartite-type tricarboxylate transporter receptor subunit TctC